MCVNEFAVQLVTRGCEHAFRHLDAGFAQHGYAASADLGERVRAPHHHTLHTAVHKQFGAWGGLAIVGTGLQGDVNGAFGQQALVAHRGHGVHLGMRTAPYAVVSLAYNPAPGICNHRAHHRVGGSEPVAGFGQLQGASHHLYVEIGFHVREISENY